MKPFAVVVPVGPWDAEMRRLRDLVESLTYYESRLGWLVLVDDAAPPRRPSFGDGLPAHVQVITLQNPRNGRGYAYLGGLAVGVLSAFAWLWRHADPSFTLKLDTDSLVIGPFASAVAERLRAAPAAGLIGALGKTCNRACPDFGRDVESRSPIIGLLEDWRARPAPDTPGPAGEPPSPDAVEREAVGRIRRHIEAAERHGYRTLQYCQGGGYAVSPAMLTRMAASGAFDDMLGWAYLPVGEDVIVGMLARSVGLEVVDASSDGEPFGVQSRGLAFSPEDLVGRGYAIVHSVRTDAALDEAHIRRLFASRRTVPAVAAAPRGGRSIP